MLAIKAYCLISSINSAVNHSIHTYIPRAVPHLQQFATVSKCKNLVALGLKWGRSNDEFKGENPKGPKVHLFIIGRSVDHLRWEIVKRTAESAAFRRGSVDAPSKVGYLQIPLDVQKEIFRLYVAMNHLVAKVALKKSYCNRLNKHIGPLLVIHAGLTLTSEECYLPTELEPDSVHWACAELSSWY